MSRHAIRRLGQVWAVVTGCLLALIVVTHGSSHAAPTDNSYSVANSLERPAGVKGRVFFGSTFYIDKESANRRIVISGSADGTASFYVDDLLDAVVTRPDGTMVTTQIDDSNGCTAHYAIARAPVNISEYFGIGTNKVQVTFRDACGGGYGNSDIWVTGSVTFPSPRPSLPFIDGGKFVAIIYDNSNKGLICTSGFSVQKNGIKYMVTAKHCFDGKIKGDDQTTNVNIPGHAPLDVRTADSYQTYAFVTELSCLSGQSDCLLPPSKSVPGDMVAFRPDKAVPRGLIRTPHGLLPVKGALPWNQGQVLCHYGAGIGGEACGKVTSSAADAGLVTYDASSRCGDSGGPVYSYTNDSAGRRNGVLIAGIDSTGGAGPDGCKIGSVSQFTPISAIEAALGVTLVTG